MSEKVKLPKEVCDALDYVKQQYDYLTILNRSRDGRWIENSLRTLNDVDSDLIMRALVLGYEPELTPEERIKGRYKNGFRGDSQGIFRAGIREALQIHGIRYDWMEGDAE